jgi:hypothetical protein
VVANEHFATYSMKQTLDTHGVRKPTVVGGTPIVNITAQGYDTSGVIADSWGWTLDYFGYCRALWETP